MKENRGRRALLIGINEYPNLDANWQLHGPANDVDLLRGVLESQFDWDPQSIQTLTDTAATTRQALLGAFRDFVDLTQTNEEVLIFYGGHGSTVKDVSGDESSALDSTLVPSDSARPPENAPPEEWDNIPANQDILDDEIQVFLSQLVKKTPYLTVIFDCCHSGTITRGTKSRALPTDPRPVQRSRTRSAGADVPVERGPSGWQDPAGAYTLFAACRDTEKALEHHPDPGNDGPAYGTLSYFLCQELVEIRNEGKPVSYRDVFERVSNKVLLAKRGKQHPQLEGNADRELFGLTELPPVSLIQIQKRFGAEVHLNAGLAHMVSRGSVWNVYPADTRVNADDAPLPPPLGEIQIASVNALDAKALIIGEAVEDSIDEGCVVSLAKRAHGDDALPVYFGGEGAAAPAEAMALATRLTKSPYVRPSPQQADAALSVFVLDKRTAAGPTDPAPMLGALTEPTFAVLDDGGALVLPPQPTRHGADPVADAVESWARYKKKVDLANPGSDLEHAVTLELWSQDDRGDWLQIPSDPSLGMPVLTAGQTVQIRLQNHSHEPLHVGVFALAPDGEVILLHPLGSHEPLAADHLYYVEGGEGTQAGWPETFPFIPNPWTPAPTEAVSVLKAIVTREPTNFEILEQKAASTLVRRSGAEESPLQLLLRSSGGGTTRSAGPVPTSGWATVTCAFVLRAQTESAVNNTEGASFPGAAATAPGISAPVRLLGQEQSIPDGPGGRLTRALEQLDLRTTQTLAVGDGEARATRSGAEPSLDLEVAAPPEGWGQVALSIDENGHAQWHVPVGTRSATRSGGSGDGEAPRSDSFRIPLETAELQGGATDGPRTRGLVTGAVKRLLKVTAFPLVTPYLEAIGKGLTLKLESMRRPTRLRSFGASEYTNKEASLIEGERLRALGEGRSLLFLPGTVLQAHHTYSKVPGDLMAALEQRYDGRVLAFDFASLSVSPETNAKRLLDLLPPDQPIELDVVGHGVGGLIARALAERTGSLAGVGTNVSIANAVLVGAPNAGTPLADEAHIQKMLNTFTSLFTIADFLPDTGLIESLELVVSIVKQMAIGAWEGLEGLQSIRPDSAFIEQLNASAGQCSSRYFGVASAYGSVESGVTSGLVGGAMRSVFGKSQNDAVVESAGVVDLETLPIAPDARILLEGTAATHHIGYFTSPEVHKALGTWLAPPT